MAERGAWPLLKQTFSEYSEDKVPRLSAALAYYTLFALAPLLIIIIFVAGKLWDAKQASKAATDQLRNLMGDQGAQVIQTAMTNAGQHGHGVVATIISVVILLLGATGVFGELQDSLNTIWEVKPKPMGFWGMVRERFLSFTMIMGMAFLLLVSLVVSTALSAGLAFIGNSGVGQLLNQGVSLVVYTLLFAMIFKLLPDTQVRWRDVWLGAAVTAILFTLGKWLIGLYLARGTVQSVFGGAGSIVAVLVWVYYSAQILFIGAEFTQVYAKMYGAGIKPSENAEFIEPATGGQQKSEQREAALAARSAGSRFGPERYFPAVPVNRSLAVATSADEQGGSSRLIPLLIGVTLGKLLLGGGKKKKRKFAATRLVEPGWVSRNRKIQEKEYVLRVRPPEFARKAAYQVSKAYHKAKDRIAEYAS